MNKIITKDNRYICQKCDSEIKRCTISLSVIRDGCLRLDDRPNEKREADQNIYYPFKYRGLIREGLHKFKYNRALSLLDFFAEKLYIFLKTDILPYEDINFIGYVPLHGKKLKERGFNQAKLLAKELSKRSKIKLLDRLLYRTVYTPSQSKLSKEERKINIDGVFKVNLKYKNLIQGSKVLLIDDIITTGSTTAECAKELKRIGAYTVVLTVAGG